MAKQETKKTNPFHKLVHKVKKDNEDSARKRVIEELFYDFNRSRAEVYRVNFFRGMFFAVGSLVGGAVLIVVVVFVLNQLVDLPGGIGNFVQSVLDAMSQRT